VNGLLQDVPLYQFTGLIKNARSVATRYGGVAIAGRACDKGVIKSDTYVIIDRVHRGRNHASEVAGITNTIVIGIQLIWILNSGAVIARIANPITIRI
jgi:hypothetical protein